MIDAGPTTWFIWHGSSGCSRWPVWYFHRHPADRCLAPWLTRPAPADDDPLLTRLGDIVGFYDHAMALWAAADCLPLNVHQFSLEEALADPAGAFARLYQFLALPAAAVPARLAADPDDAPGRHRRFAPCWRPTATMAPWVAAWAGIGRR